ncbi:unnamed protein product [Bursaphelenchus okinawaensis]|uniref:Uncharacterized protein n=1 Tax=Bursaphelenchus okinawaensis TaxID=465554 RepID=A0A811LKA9_9BILA|nr:unnamed protein product [Bursaphelenchus okinawaensis]CAG9124079.1 unnamed protein product [Bursaphelenchus okinawaensis]
MSDLEALHQELEDAMLAYFEKYPDPPAPKWQHGRLQAALANNDIDEEEEKAKKSNFGFSNSKVTIQK